MERLFSFVINYVCLRTRGFLIDSLLGWCHRQVEMVADPVDKPTNAGRSKPEIHVARVGECYSSGTVLGTLANVAGVGIVQAGTKFLSVPKANARELLHMVQVDKDVRIVAEVLCKRCVGVFCSLEK